MEIQTSRLDNEDTFGERTFLQSEDFIRLFMRGTFRKGRVFLESEDSF